MALMEPTAAPVRFSLVVPAWNEAGRLPALLDSVDAARRRWNDCGRDPQALEVVVADNGSTDQTATIAAMRGAHVAEVAKRRIAAARNGGAALARGEILGFVDADSVLHPDTFLAIDAAMDDPRTVAGATGVTMERWSAGIALTYAMGLPLVWLTGFDSGVVFCRHADFDLIGGYDEERAVAEDVDFLRRLRRLGKTRGQSLQRLRGVKTVTSTRKWDEHGDWHWFTRMPAIAWQLLRDPRGLPEAARRYWYDGR
jgi:glycosyltransferase involved in cell wall biosynthesis